MFRNAITSGGLMSRPTAVAQSPLAAHLETLPGKRDVLRFDTFSEASDAAWKIREEHPDVFVKASCDRVTISLTQED